MSLSESSRTFTPRQRESCSELNNIGLNMSRRYVDEIDSVDDTDKYISPPLMCLIEKSKKGATKVNVNIAMITVCPHTGDVAWDEFEGTSSL